jgi:hypothetical protein
VSGRGEDQARRRAGRGRTLVRILVCGLLLTVLTTAALACGCGAASDAETGAYLGSWQRVVAGEPDPSHVLHVERRGDSVRLTFSDDSGPKAGEATLEDGCLVMSMPAANGIMDGATGLQLSLGDSGQLVVDRVLDDGTTEPVWVYDRTAPVGPAP